MGQRSLNSSHSTSCSAAPAAFPYVHLLVLIAIVALLIALLIPTVERTREQSRLTACKENLRRSGSALSLYARANGGFFPVSSTIGNPHAELIASLSAGKFVTGPAEFYCPAQLRPEFSFSEQNYRAGNIGYYYFSAASPGDDPALSKFLRHGISWPRALNLKMSPNTWVMSDIWMSGLPTAHAGYKKGVNYLMLDGSVDFVTESP